MVLAESCTGGLVAAELAKVPGVSNWLCGSAVTYRSATKVAWLEVDPNDIDKHTAVSHQVALAMTLGVLSKTPEAGIAASITGHLGPDAPAGLDGVVFIGVAQRSGGAGKPNATRHQLKTSTRVERQAEAAFLVVQSLLGQLA